MHCSMALSRYGVNNKKDGGHAVVKEMIIALVKRDNFAGLTDQIESRKIATNPLMACIWETTGSHAQG